jgi:hypothetical protein
LQLFEPLLVFAVLDQINQLVLGFWGTLTASDDTFLGAVGHGLTEDCFVREAQLGMSEENLIFSLVV